jgi:arylsulfatase A
VDLLPTICEVAGVAQPADRVLDGVSLMPLFTGEELERNHPLYWFYTGSRPIAAMRQGPWSLIADPTIDISTDNFFKEEWIGDVKSTDLTNFRLFNLREDIGQDTDVSAEHPEVLEELKETLRAVHRDVVTEAPDWREMPE